jgi:hypothetical protein
VISINDLATPIVTIGQNPQEPVAPGNPTSLNQQRALFKEKEPNDQITEANLIELETRVQGTIATKQDRDFFKLRTSNRSPSKIRVILRKLSSDGFWAKVYVYDQVERREHGTGIGSAPYDQPISLTFENTPNSSYFILVRTEPSIPFSGRKAGPYELAILEE